MTTAPTTSTPPLLALYGDLATIYDSDGKRAVFASAVERAREHGITRFWPVAYIVYVLAREREDTAAAASAMASYAERALPHNRHEHSTSPEARSAFIAMTMASYFDEFSGADEVAALLEEWGDMPPPITFDAGEIPPAEEAASDD